MQLKREREEEEEEEEEAEEEEKKKEIPLLISFFPNQRTARVRIVPAL